MNTPFKGIFKSRKFWAAVIAVVYSFVAVLWPDFPIDEAAATNGVWAIVAYILGVAIEDGLTNKKE